jgi:hypothetical protein
MFVSSKAFEMWSRTHHKKRFFSVRGKKLKVISEKP